MKVVVICPPFGANEAELRSAFPVPDHNPCGGERSLYELALAAAVKGWDVELRGLVGTTALTEMADVVGALPALPASRRSPDAADVVIVPEGYPSREVYAEIASSPSIPILFILGPLGLCGWDFVGEGRGADPLTVPEMSVGRPEQYRAADAMGFSLLTISEQIAAAAVDAGVAAACTGVGWPGGLPDAPLEKTCDVVVVGNSRWFPLAQRVLSDLDVEYDVIPEVGHAQMLERLGRGRILILPSRIEGVSRISCEARAVGTVPVVLSSNRYGLGFNREGGIVSVDSLEDMASAVHDLLARPVLLQELSARGVAYIGSAVDWSSYVDRVDMALARVSTP